MLPTRATLQMPKRVLSLDMADILKTRIANCADTYQWQLICAIDAVLKDDVTMTPAQAYDFRETVDGLAFFTFRTLEGDWRHDAMALVYVAGHSEGHFPWYLESSDSKLYMRVDDVVAFQSDVRERVSLYRDAFLKVLLPAFDAGFDEFKPHARDELITRVYQVFQLVIGSWILEVLKSTKAVPNDCAMPVSWIETRPLKPVVLKATKLPPLQLFKPLPLMATELKPAVTPVTPTANVGGVVDSKQATPVTPRTPVILETPETPVTPITPMAQVPAVTPSTDEEFNKSSLGYCADVRGAEESYEPGSTEETTDSEDSEESSSAITCDMLEVDDVTVPKSAKDDDDCQGVRASTPEKVYMSVDDAIAAIAARSDHFEASILRSIDATLTAHGVGTSSPADSSLRHALMSDAVKNIRDLVTEWGWDVMMAVEAMAVEAMESVSSSATTSAPMIKSSVETQTTQISAFPTSASIPNPEPIQRSTLIEPILSPAKRTPVIVPPSPEQDEGCSTCEGKPHLCPEDDAHPVDSVDDAYTAERQRFRQCHGVLKMSTPEVMHDQEQQKQKQVKRVFKKTPPMVRDTRGHRIHRPAGESAIPARPKSLTVTPPPVRQTHASLARSNATARRIQVEGQGQRQGQSRYQDQDQDRGVRRRPCAACRHLIGLCDACSVGSEKRRHARSNSRWSVSSSPTLTSSSVSVSVPPTSSRRTSSVSTVSTGSILWTRSTRLAHRSYDSPSPGSSPGSLKTIETTTSRYH